MICGKCNTEQDLVRRDIDGKTFTYWCPNCKDQISPDACYLKDSHQTKPLGVSPPVLNRCEQGNLTTVNGEDKTGDNYPSNLKSKEASK